MFNVGHRVPPFELLNQDGVSVSLSESRGKWIVIYFYPKDDTPGCTTEACALRDSRDDLKKHGVVVYGVSRDSVASHKKFHEKFALNFDLLSDPERKVIEAWGAWGERSMYGRKYMGILRMTYVIAPDFTVAKVFPKVTPRGHEKEIVKFIEAA